MRKILNWLFPCNKERRGNVEVRPRKRKRKRGTFQHHFEVQVGKQKFIVYPIGRSGSYEEVVASSVLLLGDHYIKPFEG